MAAARLGAAVTFVGAVGSDVFGREAIAELRNEGIDVTRLAVLSGESTGIALIVVDVHGQNQIAVASGANARVTGELVQRALAADGETPANASQGPGAYLRTWRCATTRSWPARVIPRPRGMAVIVNPAPARALNSELSRCRRS